MPVKKDRVEQIITKPREIEKLTAQGMCRWRPRKWGATDLTDDVRSSSQTPQPRISSRRVRTPAFPFSRTSEILRKVRAAPAVERSGSFRNPRSLLHLSGRIIRELARNRTPS